MGYILVIVQYFKRISCLISMKGTYAVQKQTVEYQFDRNTW